MTTTALGNFVIQNQKLLQYTPGVSTVVGLVYLFQKYVFTGNLSPAYKAHLIEKSIARCLLMIFVPVLGNIAIALIDFAKNRAIEAVRNDDRFTDPDVQRAALLSMRSQIAFDGKQIQHASETVKANRDTVLAALKQEKRPIVDGPLKNEHYEFVLSHAASSLFADPEFIIKVTEIDPSLFSHIGSKINASFWENEEALLQVIPKLGSHTEIFSLHLPQSLRKKFDFMLKMVAANVDAGILVHAELLDSSEFMKEAIEKRPGMALWLSPSRKKDEEFILSLLSLRSVDIDLAIVYRIDSSLLRKVEFFQKATASNPRLKSDERFLRVSIEANPKILELVETEVLTRYPALKNPVKPTTPGATTAVAASS